MQQYISLCYMGMIAITCLSIASVVVFFIIDKWFKLTYCSKCAQGITDDE